MSASSILCRLRYKGHITNVEYQKLMDAKNKGKQTIPKSVIEDIRSEIAEYRDNFVLAGRGNIASAVDNCNRIIDKHIKAVEE